MIYRLALRCIIDRDEESAYDMEISLPETHESEELAIEDTTAPRFYKTDGKVFLTFEKKEEGHTDQLLEMDYAVFRKKYKGRIRKQAPGHHKFIIFDREMIETSETWADIFADMANGESFIPERAKSRYISGCR